MKLTQLWFSHNSPGLSNIQSPRGTVTFWRPIRDLGVVNLTSQTSQISHLKVCYSTTDTSKVQGFPQGPERCQPYSTSLLVCQATEGFPQLSRLPRCPGFSPGFFIQPSNCAGSEGPQTVTCHPELRARPGGFLCCPGDCE